MALWIGIDDTDSRAGGCTTALAEAVIRLFPELAPEGPPRLVRLNPNIPWKTRGNGAIALAFRGTVGPDEALDRVRSLVEREAQRAPGTDPGVVVATRRSDPSLYHAAVTRVVTRDEVDVERAWGGRGVIGAAAAIAWPAERATWERIAYRDRLGPRDVDPARVRDVETDFDSLFDSYDLIEDEVVCVPSSPCPVLWGLRGSDPSDLAKASERLGPQRPVRETLFLTNHASDDHLVDRAPEEAAPFESARVRGRVADTPVERNGHVFARVGRLRVAAYAPTRSFRAVVARLRAGDDITVCGGVHGGPDGEPTLGIEKMLVHATTPRRVGNPVCPACARTMKSVGAGKGYRCCGRTAALPRTEGAGLEGWHEVPASARRHLARPLKLRLQ